MMNAGHDETEECCAILPPFFRRHFRQRRRMFSARLPVPAMLYRTHKSQKGVNLFFLVHMPHQRPGAFMRRSKQSIADISDKIVFLSVNKEPLLAKVDIRNPFFTV